MLFVWRFSRTFASRFNFANVVFFLPAKVDLQVAQRTAPTGGALSTVLRSADARPHLKEASHVPPNAPSGHRAEASLRLPAARDSIASSIAVAARPFTLVVLP